MVYDCNFCFTICVALENPNVEFESSDVDRLFKQLETYGETKLTYYKNLHKEELKSDFIRQYLAVAVLSKEEVQDSKNWAGQMPEWWKGNNSRLQLIFNKKIEKGVFHTNHKKPLHGEIIFLHLDSKLDEMLNSFKAKQKESFSFVFCLFVLHPLCQYNEY